MEVTMCIYIRRVFKLRYLNISKTKHFRKKNLKQKLFGFLAGNEGVDIIALFTSDWIDVFNVISILFDPTLFMKIRMIIFNIY